MKKERRSVSEGGRERELVFANTRSARDRNFAGVQKSRGGISAAAAADARDADAPIDGMSKRRMDCRSLKRSRSWLPP